MVPVVVGEEAEEVHEAVVVEAGSGAVAVEVADEGSRRGRTLPWTGVSTRLMRSMQFLFREHGVHSWVLLA